MKLSTIYEQIWHKGETGESAAGVPVSGQPVPRNMLVTNGRRLLPSVVRIPSPQAQRSWLKEEAVENMDSMSITLLTFHDEMSWLKEDALSNILHMFTQSLTFHEEMSLLN